MGVWDQFFEKAKGFFGGPEEGESSGSSTAIRKVCDHADDLRERILL